MKFSLFFFSSDSESREPYRLLLEAARFADQNGFDAIWTPERHFDRFGGCFANPALTSAALAMVTRNVQLRSGSLISPLHDVLRIAEEWAMVDQLSNGRAAISFGSGWNANDFAFFPDRYAERQAVMYEQIAQLRGIWKTGSIERQSQGNRLRLEVFPRPVRAELPIWVTTSGSRETYASAGELGANVLTHLIMQDIRALTERVALYRTRRAESGHDPRTGVVSLMLHTFLGPEEGAVRELVRPFMREYLRSAAELEIKAARVGAMSGSLSMPDEAISPSILDEMLELTFERYYESRSCLGTVDAAFSRLQNFERAGVNEIACLIDFGVPSERVLANLSYLLQLKERFDAA